MTILALKNPTLVGTTDKIYKTDGSGSPPTISSITIPTAQWQRIATNYSGTWVIVAAGPAIQNITAISCSTDDGDTWSTVALTEVTDGDGHRGQAHTLMWDGSRFVIYSNDGTDGEINSTFTSTDGLAWNTTSGPVGIYPKTGTKVKNKSNYFFGVYPTTSSPTSNYRFYRNDDLDTNFWDTYPSTVEDDEQIIFLQSSYMGETCEYNYFMKTDGINILTIKPVNYGYVQLFNSVHGEMVAQTNYSVSDSFLTQQSVYIGSSWFMVGRHSSTDDFMYGTSEDAGFTWSFTTEDIRSDLGISPGDPCDIECYDLIWDGQYVWFFGGCIESSSKSVIMRYEPDAATPTWEIWTYTGNGWLAALSDYNIFSQTLYSETATNLTVGQDTTIKIGKVLETSTPIAIDDDTNMEYMNFRTSTPISIASTPDMFKFNTIGGATASITIDQKNYFVENEEEQLVVHGLPIGVGGSNTQLNYYVREVMQDDPIVYLPMNEADEEVEEEDTF